MKKTVLSLAILLLLPLSLSAQLQESKHFNLKFSSQSFINAQFFFLLGTDASIYNINSYPLLEGTYDLNQITFNPTGSTVAILYKGKGFVDIVSTKSTNDYLFTIRDKRKGLPSKPIPASAAYTPDARELLISNSLGEIMIYGTSDYILKSTFNPGKTYSCMSVSPNLYYIVGANGNTVDVWNKETTALRKSLEFSGAVHSIAFSEDSRQMAVTYDGGVDFIDVMTMTTASSTAKDENVIDGCFHPEGKYYAFISNGSKVSIYNVKNGTIESSADFDASGSPMRDACHVTLLKNADGTFSMVSNTIDKVIIWDISFLTPFYGNLFSSDLNAGMDEWLKKAENESLDDYHIRVADENAAIQKAMLLEELATKIGMETVKFDDPFISDTYDTENHSIEVAFEGANAIQLELPESEVQNLRNGQLSFSETAFTINEKDELEFSYLVATSEVTGAKYIYDNRQYIKMQDMFGESDAEYVPVSIRQEANTQMEVLVEQKEDIVEESRTQNLITGKTEISVGSEVKADFNADGEKIYNYNLNYKYDVSAGFSAQEDFGPGKYRVEDSNAAITLLKTIDKAMSTELASYLENCSNVEITITGAADSKPVRNIPYSDIYGAFNDEPYYKKGTLSSISVSSKTNITNNEQLAFIRAVSASDWMSKNVEKIKATPEKFSFKYCTDVAENEGSEFRRIVVKIVMKDAFKK